MTDVGDSQSEAEFLDDDKLPSEYPPDRPLGVDEYGVTAYEETVPEPLEERLRREEPDFDELARRRGLDGEDADEEVGTLVDTDDGGFDDEGDSVARSIGRVSQRNLSVDDIAYGDETLRDVATERLSDEDRPAEEAAIHLIDPPPMGDGDGYVDPEADDLVDEALDELDEDELEALEEEEDHLDDADDLDDLDGSDD
jgi:hypothetical protein